jgi:homoaconitase/3-isopropylmalate dehydratase large subunit
MKNLVAALTVVLFTGAAQASTSSLKFVSVDNSVESQTCVIAAKDGYNAALNYASQSGQKNVFAMTCNGQNIQDFSKAYQVAEVAAKTVVVVPANNNDASKVCAQAVANGLDYVLSNASFDVNQMRCNGQKLSTFVKQYSTL